MDHPDRHAELAALEALLRSPEARWATLAPVLVERMGADRLRSVVAATLERLGGLTGVDDGSAGLRVHGPAGHVLAWAHVDATGALDGLMLAPRLQRRGLSPAAGLRVRAVVLLALFALAVLQAWRATTVGDWAADLAGESVVAVVLGGVTPWRTLPAALRAPIGALATVGAASAVRLPGLPAGDITGSALEFLLVAGLLVLVGRSRRFRWGTPGSTLSFPLRGPWYVMQGGGRLLNHHAGLPEQRAAVDLLRVGRWGTRRRGARRDDPASYLAFGAPVHAPCGGRVVSAVGDLPDQVPGRPRYGPPYGNHVAIDNGTGTVRLAHLRQGSVRVAAGDVVRAGQVLGEVGNSGNSSEPHLHVHADQDGDGLDLVFADVPGALFRGRSVRAG